MILPARQPAKRLPPVGRLPGVAGTASLAGACSSCAAVRGVGFQPALLPLGRLEAYLTDPTHLPLWQREQPVFPTASSALLFWTGRVPSATFTFQTHPSRLEHGGRGRRADRPRRFTRASQHRRQAGPARRVL